jgi:tetratricopeptide (TPR) repeat protein
MRSQIPIAIPQLQEQIDTLYQDFSRIIGSGESMRWASVHKYEISMLYYQQGLEYRKIGEHYKAFDHIGQALAWSNHEPLFYRDLGLILLDLGNDLGALQNICMYKANTESEEANKLYGLVLESTEKTHRLPKTQYASSAAYSEDALYAEDEDLECHEEVEQDEAHNKPPNTSWVDKVTSKKRLANGTHKTTEAPSRY